MTDAFDVNVQKLTAACAYAQTLLAVSREMFGKGYFALGQAERAVVDRNTWEMVGAHYQNIPEWVGTTPTPGRMGFQSSAARTSSSSPASEPPRS